MKARMTWASDAKEDYDQDISTLEELQKLARDNASEGWGKRLILQFDEVTEVEGMKIVQVKRPLTVTIYDHYVE